jgi:hypothetical protein
MMDGNDERRKAGINACRHVIASRNSDFIREATNRHPPSIICHLLNQTLFNMRSSFFTIFLGCLFLTTAIQAQSDSADTKTQFKLGVYYNSHLNYYGRTDSLKSSGVFPMAELVFGNGVYINAAPVFVNNALVSFEYAGTVATAGYRFNSKNKFTGNIYVVKPIYKDNSELVQSALKAQFTSQFTWLNKIINVTGGADLKLSDNLDYGATAGIDHIFRFEPGRGVVLVLDPSANINAGTQRFSKTYYKKSSFLFFPGVEQEVTESVNQFKVLSYEFSMPVVLARGKFQFIANPAYVLPQNLVVTERGENMFYITVGMKVNL